LLLTSFTFAALIAGSAIAVAQQPRVYRRPVVVAAPVYTWTGFYVGGNVGYSWGDARTDLAGNGSGMGDDVPYSFTFATSNTTKLNGVIGGGQVGYNYQISPNWVLGFEADIQGSGERGSGQLAGPFTTPICFFQGGGSCVDFSTLNGAAATTDQFKIDWFGTVRVRLGLLVDDQLLVYGTGGLAYGRVAVSSVTNVSAIPLLLTPFTPVTGAFADSKTNVGFSVGGGIEGRLSYWLPRNWTWKLEYLYLDLGSLDTTTASFTMAPPPNTSDLSPITGTITTTHRHFTDNIVRVGLNYKFGNYYTPH
jgi:outer membrane immunogenic protein